jgi:hypothetical protein
MELFKDSKFNIEFVELYENSFEISVKALRAIDAKLKKGEVVPLTQGSEIAKKIRSAAAILKSKLSKHVVRVDQLLAAYGQISEQTHPNFYREVKKHIDALGPSQSKQEEKPAPQKTKLEEVKTLLLFEQVPGQNNLNKETVKAYETCLMEDPNNKKKLTQALQKEFSDKNDIRELDANALQAIYAQIPEDMPKFKELFKEVVSQNYGILLNVTVVELNETQLSKQ